MMYGRKEIEAWFKDYLLRSKGLVDVAALTPDELFMLVGSNLGWNWDVDDVGRAPCRHTGAPDTLSGMYQFLRELIQAATQRSSDASRAQG